MKPEASRIMCIIAQSRLKYCKLRNMINSEIRQHITCYEHHYKYVFRVLVLICIEINYQIYFTANQFPKQDMNKLTCSNETCV